MKGKFIVFEGGEGAGKGTQIELLKKRLMDNSYSVKVGREPGHTEIGKVCRTLLKDPKYSPNAITELFLFSASRSEHVEKEIMPVLDKVDLYISDRFYDSTTVYQGVARKLGVDLVQTMNKIATDGLVPDLTIVLDVNSEEGVSNAIEQARFELEGDSFHKTVNAAYRKLPEMFPDRNIIVVPRKSIEEVHESVYRIVSDFLEK